MKIRGVFCCRGELNFSPVFFYQQEGNIACYITQGIQNQVVYIRHSLKEGQLQNFNGEGESRTCGDHFPGLVQFFKYIRPDHTNRNKHCDIADDIDLCFFPAVITEHVDKGFQVEAEGITFVWIKYKRLEFSVDFFKGTEGKADDDHDADIYKNQLGFPFPADLLAPVTEITDDDPQDRYNDDHCCVGYFDQVSHLFRTV